MILFGINVHSSSLFRDAPDSFVLSIILNGIILGIENGLFSSHSIQDLSCFLFNFYMEGPCVENGGGANRENTGERRKEKAFTYRVMSWRV